MTATDTNVSSTRHPLRIGLVGTFPPRRCGLATFTSDVAHSLRDAHDQVVVVALVDAIERSIPGAELQPVQTSERSAADVAVRLSAEVDVVLVQHEFGIFGGRDSAVLQAFTDHLTVPFVITLHTVLEQFRPWQLTALTAPLSSAAGVFVVSAARASTIEHHSNRCRRRSASTTSCTSATGSTTSTNCRRCSTPPTCSPRRMPTPSRSSAAPCRSRSLPVPFVSTPYRYASSLAAEGCGIIVPFGDDAAFADGLVRVLTDDRARHSMAERANAVSAERSWPQVGQLIHDRLEHLVPASSRALSNRP